MKTFFKEILRDKNGRYSLRECVTILLVLIMLLSWLAQQFFGKAVPEFMFYAFTSLVAAGCFGYSIEKKTFEQPTSTQNENPPL